MNKLGLPVALFDPENPRRGVEIDAAIDIDGRHVLVSRKTISTFKNLKKLGHAELSVGYHGVKIHAESIEVGVRIGTIRIDNAKAAIVDGAPYDLIINMAVLEKCLTIGASDERSVNLSSAAKDDRAALTIEVNSLDKYIELRAFEQLTRNQRILHNLFLVTLGEVKVDSNDALSRIIEDEIGIPPNLRLSLRWVEYGSILMTLKSGSENALKYLSSLFKGGTSASLAQREADARRAEVNAEISRQTSGSVIKYKKQVEERKRSEQLNKTYQIWREEIRERIGFLDELLCQVSDQDLAKEIAKRKDQAIDELVNQNLLPLVALAPMEASESSDEDIPFLPTPEASHRWTNKKGLAEADPEIPGLPQIRDATNGDDD